MIVIVYIGKVIEMLKTYLNEFKNLEIPLKTMYLKKMIYGIVFLVGFLIVSISVGMSIVEFLKFTGLGLIVLFVYEGFVLIELVSLIKKGYSKLTGECVSCDYVSFTGRIVEKSDTQKVTISNDGYAYVVYDNRGKIRPGNIISVYMPSNAVLREKDGAYEITQKYLVVIENALTE